MKFLAVLDVGVYVFDDVFGKRRGEDAAMAKRTMAEFCESLAPGDNLVATQKLRHFTAELFFSGYVLVDDFGVVEDRFDLRGSEARTEREAAETLVSLADGVFAAEESITLQGSGR